MGGGGRRPDTSHESKRAPECHPPIPLIAARALYDTEAVVQDIVMKSLMRRIEPVGPFLLCRGEGERSDLRPNPCFLISIRRR